MKFLKYKFSAFFSDFLRRGSDSFEPEVLTELPPPPFSVPDLPSHLIGGRAGRFVSKVMRSSRGIGFAVGVLYLKKGMPRPDEALLKAACVATKKVLTTKRPVPPCTIPNLLGTPSSTGVYPTLGLPDMLSEMSRSAAELFDNHPITEEDLHHPYAPSVSADYVSSRAEFGVFGTLMAMDLIEKPAEFRRPLTGIVREQDPVKELYTSAFSELEGEEMEEEGYVHRSLDPRFKALLKKHYTGIYERARGLASSEVADVKLVALPESLKIRVISKGPPLTYFVLKPVQKFLHRILRRHPMFRLIGEPVTGSLLNEKFGAVAGYFHSLDYSSATDFLNPEVSEAVVNAICASVGMPEDIRLLFLKALTGHTVEGLPQVWGQLMGSVVSFIILCVANGAVIRKSLEVLYCRRLTLAQCDALVNGDDGAVRAPFAFLDIWKQLAALCGLEPSQGKVYSHKTYLNINSTSYLMRGGVLRLIPYVNMGLMTGQKRAGGKVSVQDVQDPEGPETLGARHCELLASCPEDMKVACHEMFLNRHWDLLSRCKVPWYVSENEGGVGLDSVKVWSFSSDDIDDASWSYVTSRAGAIYGPSDLDEKCLELLNSDSISIPVRKLPSLQPIQVRSIWSSRVKEFTRADQSLELTEDDVGTLDTSTFYFAPSLVTDQIGRNPTKVLFSNQRAWRVLEHLARSSVE